MNISFLYSSSSTRQNSKTSWPVPLIDSIFQSHFKRASRNDEFVVDKVIAKGAFGIVFKIVDKNNTNLEYALKVLSKSKVSNDSLCIDFRVVNLFFFVGNLAGNTKQ